MNTNQINSIRTTIDTIFNGIKMAKSMVDFVNNQPKKEQLSWAVLFLVIIFLSILASGNR